MNSRNSISKITGYVLLFLAVLVVVIVIYKNSATVKVPVIFSSKDLINNIWSQYKENYFEKNTMRTLDKSRNNVTTSEAESYAMLRSVWLDDHVTFDGSWQWTKDNLQQKKGSLFAWLFGQKSDGNYGVLTSVNGQNAASDADTDIALSLIFASSRWQDKKYLDEAKKIIPEIWSKEVVIINGRPYMASDDTDHSKQANIVINPSYFAPYAYRIFAEIDPSHDWKGLVDTSYEILDQTITSPLDKKKSANLPPDWIFINHTTGIISAIPDARYTTDYSYDALRIPWRMMLDYNWYKENRALNILKKMSFLTSDWNKKGRLVSDYSHDGAVVKDDEIPAMYGGSLGVFMATDKALAQKVYENKLISLFNPDDQDWRIPIGYYNENWVWFGIALYNGYLPNLWEGQSTRGGVSE
jgi:endo-1,4-beta-D-glucanase Y